MKPCIVWQTDFSLDWPFVATMKGVCKQVDASLECVDSTHTIEKFMVAVKSWSSVKQVTKRAIKERNNPVCKYKTWEPEIKTYPFIWLNDIYSYGKDKR